MDFINNDAHFPHIRQPAQFILDALHGVV